MAIRHLAPAERDPQQLVYVIRQLSEGRSDAIGTCSLATGAATTTVVLAPNCSVTSAVFLFPQTAHAAAVLLTTFVLAVNVKKGQFTISHATTANADCTFWFVCLG
jgi:hypothetical protein